MRLTTGWTLRGANEYTHGHNAKLMTLWLTLLALWLVGIPVVVLTVAAILPRWMRYRARGPVQPAATVRRRPRPSGVPVRRRAAG
jgi:hypothetical protein